MIKLNDTNCKKKKMDLEYFKGFVPFQFDCYIDLNNRENFLRTIGLWDVVHKRELEIMQGIRKYKPRDDDYLDMILKRWIKDNPQFKDCVIM